ncbi:hypothetical protein [Enterobacter hormaechei]|uniref:hypothetical protein n=1 Tax=Enterobacter hormaechei TaxID=158836 RepID=UPI001D681AB4|nr:hypothetical protein [Enterobacter hormaechei]CAE7337012.1 hypothetical protein AI2656V1_3316 [Enterobacter cloacae]MCW9749355.1 hypothetical protein [Enterobacter hormaechei]CAE7339002.1 hypothetical protein AI2657V1_3321 [Enterobacter cloacae]CAE7375196.1 hypothetical protein AI2658V1_3315 [Enterobacter cloacae]CAF2846686.1 hypothetical protein AI2939V1_3315 [Enterobacter cloacae]
MSLNNEDEKRVTEDASKLTDGAKKISGERRVISLMARNPGLINIMEMFLWFYVSFLTFMIYKSPGIDTVPSETSAFSMFLNMSAGVKALVLGLIPLAFTMVYRISPIQMILRRALSINDEVRITSVALGVVNDEPQKSKSDLAEGYLSNLVVSSARLSKDIYSRGSLYILFGVIFSIVGLVFFYSQVHVSDSLSTVVNIPKSNSFVNELVYLAPKFGILFFIELISFFFLKQYRVTMDEFRYYEAIKRSREETLAVVKLLSVNSENVDYMAVLDRLKFSSNVGRLESGQTTELLEARRFDKDELDFLAKIAEVVAKKG